VKCRVAGNRRVACGGEFVPSEGACFRHAALFDIWIAEYGGWKVYGFTAEGEAGETPTQGETNPPALRRWKRAQFHAWLDRIGEAGALRILGPIR